MSSSSPTPSAIRAWWTSSTGKESDCLRTFSPYDLYPIRSSGIRSLSVTIFFVDEHLSLRTFSRTIFIPYDILAYDLYPVRSFSFTNICHYEHYTVRTLSATIFRHTNFCLRTSGIRTLAIRSFVRTPGKTRI